jgi:PDZ domain-containing secreted protein
VQAGRPISCTAVSSKRHNALVACRGLAGIIRGDVIVGVDTIPIKSGSDLIGALDGYKVGDTVTLKVQRGEVSAFVSVQLVSCPSVSDMFTYEFLHAGR